MFPTFASALGLDHRHVWHRARYIREAGLLPGTAGKRLAMASPRTCASLLAHFLVDDTVVRAAAAVALAHELRAVSYKINDAPVDAPPPGALFGLAAEHSFVDAIEALIAYAAEYGDIIGPSGLPLTPISVQVERPWCTGTITLVDGDHRLSITYQPPAPGGSDQEVAAAMTAKFGGGDLHTIRRIGETTIYALAAALRGEEAQS